MAKTSYEFVNKIKYYYKYIELPRNSEGKRIRKKFVLNQLKNLMKKLSSLKMNKI